MLWETIRSPVMIYLFLFGNLLLVGCSVAFFFTERDVNPNVDSIFDALWWGIATVTTVGFGDIAPVTPAGRLIGFVLIATGVILFVGSTAIFSSIFFARTRKDIFDLERESRAEWKQVHDEIAALRRDIHAMRGGPRSEAKSYESSRGSVGSSGVEVEPPDQ